MKLKSILLVLLVVANTTLVFSQTIISEDFESVTHPALPALWTTSSNAIDGGFYTGDADSAIAGNFWVVDDHTTFAMTNDDACGSCDKSNDFLIMPNIDLSAYVDSTIYLQFDTWMEDFWLGIGTIKVDTGSGWIDVYTIEPIPAWQTRVVCLSQFAGNSTVSVAFHYNDQNTSSLGLAIDNVSIYVPSSQYDAALYSNTNTYSDYVQTSYSQLIPITLSSTVYNNGKDTLHNVKLIAQCAQSSFVDTNIVGDLAPAEYSSFDFSNNLTLSNVGQATINYSIVHNNVDGYAANNTEDVIVQVSDSVMAKESGSFTATTIITDGETLAQHFKLFRPDTITSISVHHYMFSVADEVKFFIYDIASDLPNNKIDSSESFNPALSGWSTYILADSIMLAAGEYAIGMEKKGFGMTSLNSNENYYTANTTFHTIFEPMSSTYYWYNDEQAVLAAPPIPAKHHTYLMRPNFGGGYSVGINNLGNDNVNIDIYPNPSRGIVNIKGKDISKVDILDIQGNLIMTTTSNSVDMSKLSNGIYIFLIHAENTISTKKVVLNK